jgi:snurportin-1
MPRFPSPLPPLTVLDCILDPNWRQNGILHVLDVLTWKSRDIGDCETPFRQVQINGIIQLIIGVLFRFWWRDTRLAELPRFSPPSVPATRSAGHAIPDSSSPQDLATIPEQTSHYRFSYPTTLIPVPYYTDTTLPFLSSHIIPLARSLRSVVVEIPATSAPVFSFSVDSVMDVDNSASPSLPPFPVASALVSTLVDVFPDGMLLYAAQASYEPGTTPLSSWIPITGYSEIQGSGARGASSHRPLDTFER